MTLLIQALDSVPTDHKSPQVLVVTQSSATGQAHLPGTLQELKFIEDQVTKNNIILSISLKGSDATVSWVKREMLKASWVHFACHGVQAKTQQTVPCFCQEARGLHCLKSSG